MAFFYNAIFISTHLGSTSNSAKTLIQESTGIVHLTPTHQPSQEAGCGCAPHRPLSHLHIHLSPQTGRHSKAGQPTLATTLHIHSQQ